MAVGFWGAYFGAAALALAGAFIFMRSAPRVAYTGALAVVLSVAYALVFLGWVPVAAGDALMRLQAFVAIASAAVLVLLMFMLLGTFRKHKSMRRARLAAVTVTALGSLASWQFVAQNALGFSVILTITMACAAIVAGVAAARRGERAGRFMLGALPCAIVGVVCLDWIAIQPATVGWEVHAVSAVAGIAYLVCIALAMWSRYSYLIEVRRVMSLGPDYDPVTWLPSFDAGNQLPDDGTRPVGVIVVSIANLTMVEELHGRAAYNHALLACALRLRRCGFFDAELWRLREDAFVFVFRRVSDAEQLLDHSRQVLRRLSRPVRLASHRSGPDAADAEWEPNAGVGVLVECENTPLEIVIAGARATSRTAWTYQSRMAWFDEAGGEISELPSIA